ncbi:AT-rich interactive domain-containing protein 3B-like isoform X1 [Hemiscyllium ocellatum]|uniref:AT-rich interactive domain-containing protein 3B-like isoform X1 n=1 Tax=Hemiscyllium ocellatum TaxID=170820 RepID=UPI0029671DDE|nr:AT-rich interactive domain-containing protein 3B-like isoform X1 [Hemiscyllium ocellatum]
MVENTGKFNSTSAPMPGLTTGEELNLVLTGSSQFHHQGMKLEAVMEHLQRQQQVRLEMEGRERKDRDVHHARIFYAQQMAAASSRSPPASPLVAALARQSALAVPQGSDKSSEDSEAEDDAFEREDAASELEDEDAVRGELDEEDDGEEEDVEYLRKRPAAMLSGQRAPPAHRPSVSGQSQQQGNSQAISPSPAHLKSPASHHDWGYEEQFKQIQPSDWMANDQSELGKKNSHRPGSVPGAHIPGTIKQNGSLAWNDDADGGRAREAAKDFAKLYELDSDPKRKEFLDDLFVFMQKRGTPVNRIPIMAKQVLDLYMLYKLVTEKGGLVEVINKKIWREITKGLNLPTSITSAAFTLRTQYMKYLYPYECEKQSLSSPTELQAAIDSNRREGRRPSYSSALFGYSPCSATPLLSPAKVHLSSLNVPTSNGIHLSPGQLIKKEDTAGPCSLTPSRIHVPLSQTGNHSTAQAVTLEQLREKLESGEPPEKRMARLAEGQQRLMQQALQQNLFAMATHVPMSIKINGKDDRQELALNLSTNGISSINMSIEINGTLYTGVLFAQRPAVHVIAGPSSSTSGSQSTSSPTSVKGPASAEPSTSGSP